jgi:hypothetical protein
MEPGLRTKLLTAVTLVLVFATGGIAGYAMSARDGDAAEPERPTRRPYVFEQFERTPAQQAQIDSILRSHRKTMDRFNAELRGIRQQYQAASDSLSRATGEAIALVLPPDVAAEYRERLAESRAERMRARAEAEADRGSRGDGR